MILRGGIFNANFNIGSSYLSLGHKDDVLWSSRHLNKRHYDLAVLCRLRQSHEASRAKKTDDQTTFLPWDDIAETRGTSTKGEAIIEEQSEILIFC
jgi:hypothetical protein